MAVKYFKQAWLVIVLSLGFGLALAGVQGGLGPKIDRNKLNETLSQVPKLVPGADAGDKVVVGGREVFRATRAGQPVGWVLQARGQGFGDVIEVLIGLDAKVERITGLYVLDQKETPGLGDRIRGQEFRGQYAGKPAGGTLKVVKGKAGAPTEIEAITGATISSESVTSIVNQAVAEFRKALAEGKE